MRKLTKSYFYAIDKDYRSVWKSDSCPEYIGRRTAFLPGDGTKLSVEGVHFLVEGDYSHLPVLCKSNAKEGFAYSFAGGFQLVKKLYDITEDFAKENNLAYLNRVITSVADFALTE